MLTMRGQSLGADAALDSFFVKDWDDYTVFRDPQTGSKVVAAYWTAGVMPAGKNDGVSFYTVAQGAGDAPGLVSLSKLISATASRTPDAAFFMGRTAIKPDGRAKPLVSTGDIAQIRAYAANPDFFWLGGARPFIKSEPSLFTTDSDGYYVVKKEFLTAALDPLFRSYAKLDFARGGEFGSDGVGYLVVSAVPTQGEPVLKVMSDVSNQFPQAAFFMPESNFGPGNATTIIAALDTDKVIEIARDPNGRVYIGGARPALSASSQESKQAGMGAGTVLLVAGGVALAYYLIAGQKKPSYGYSPNRRRRRH